MTAAMPDLRLHTDSPLRVLVAVHGHEMPGWAPAACRLVSTWAEPSLRLLEVLDVPRPPFTSLTGMARAAYGAARARWAELERGRVQPAVEGLRAGLRADAEVASVEATHGDLARAIAEAASAWPADVVVVGPPAPGPRSWVRTGPVHERLVRLAPCTVIVIAEPLTTTPGGARLVTVPAAAGQGA